MAGTQCKFFSTISTSHTTFFLRSTNDTCVNSNNSLTQLLSCVETVDKWKLMHRAELASWINPQANLVLIGDSCHPMLPYLAQGANSSIEDGAVLGLLLAPHYFSSKAQLPETLKLFERVRKERGEQIARETFKQRHDFHMAGTRGKRRVDAGHAGATSQRSVSQSLDLSRRAVLVVWLRCSCSRRIRRSILCT
jgi:2-polyprenyl-6-methoxyphenol hydroxylase-like FAD-dependent oxidoreductase